MAAIMTSQLPHASRPPPPAASPSGDLLRAAQPLYDPGRAPASPAQEKSLMAKAYEAPAGVEIAALKNKKTTGPMDLMMPGDGTPWEDRGNLGTLKAFLQTAVSSITKPARLLDHIRRPD